MAFEMKPRQADRQQAERVPGVILDGRLPDSQRFGR
jgi:hypothetical protein